jgi:hypothetical protein
MQKCILYVPKLEVKGCKMHPYILVTCYVRTTRSPRHTLADRQSNFAKNGEAENRPE